jgi:hypothetical protein
MGVRFVVLGVHGAAFFLASCNPDLQLRLGSDDIAHSDSSSASEELTTEEAGHGDHTSFSFDEDTDTTVPLEATDLPNESASDGPTTTDTDDSALWGTETLFTSRWTAAELDAEYPMVSFVLANYTDSAVSVVNVWLTGVGPSYGYMPPGLRRVGRVEDKVGDWAIACDAMCASSADSLQGCFVDADITRPLREAAFCAAESGAQVEFWQQRLGVVFVPKIYRRTMVAGVAIDEYCFEPATPVAGPIEFEATVHVLRDYDSTTEPCYTGLRDEDTFASQYTVRAVWLGPSQRVVRFEVR